MKKFLTVLLALSVVFTYTVGTAFAAVPAADAKAAFNANVDAAAKIVKQTFDTNYAKAVEELTGLEVKSSWTVSKASAQTGAAEYQSDQHDAIDDRAGEMKDAYAADADAFATATVASVDALVELFAKAKTATDGTTAYTFKKDGAEPYATIANVNAGIIASDSAKLAAAKAEFAAMKADAQAALKLVDISMYSTTEKTIDGVKTSYYALAEKFLQEQQAAVAGTLLAVDDTVDKIEAKAVGETTPVSGIGTLGVADKGIMSYFEKSSDGNIVISAAGKAAATTSGIKTITEEGGSADTLAIAKQKALGIMNQNVAEYLEKTTATAPAGYTKKAIADAYVAAQTWRINSATTSPITAPAAMLSGDSAVADLENYVKNVAAIEDLEATANRYKAEKDDAGNLVRDTEKVTAVVDKAKETAFDNTATLWAGTVANVDGVTTAAMDAKLAIRDKCYVSDAKTTFAVEAKKAEIETARDAALYDANDKDKYYDQEKAKVNALFDELLAKVDAAKTDAEIAKISATPAGLSAIATKAQLISQIQTFKAFKTDYANLQNYMKYLNGSAKTYDAAYKDFTAYNAAYFAELYGENGVRANTDITSAVYDKARAVLDAVKSNGALAEEKAAVEALVTALPKYVTITDKAAVEAAWNANKTYMDNEGAAKIKNEQDLKDAVTALYQAELREANKLYTALPSKLTVSDKDAVKAYGEALKAIADKMEPGQIYEGQVALTSALANYKNAAKEIREIELKAVKDAINALPINITAADKGAVEAARALYDAYVKDYTVYETTAFADKYNPADYITNQSDLFAAEVAVKAAEKAAKIKATESLKIKASSKLYKGKKIQVKWRIADGDATQIDGYQVYKSTKANSGYKFMGKTKKLSMDNKKSLKKGTRYFYKVRAYVDVDGTRYYSDWSNKANRIYKK